MTFDTVVGVVFKIIYRAVSIVYIMFTVMMLLIMCMLMRGVFIEIFMKVQSFIK